MRRSLVLKKETVAELTPAELAEVGGAGADAGNGYPTLELGCRLSRMVNECPSIGGC